MRETDQLPDHTTMAQTGAPQRGNPNPPPQTQGPEGHVEYRNAVCGESRMYGVDAGKERKLLPMHTKPLNIWTQKNKLRRSKWVVASGRN
jgi:hypothetical protein